MKHALVTIDELRSDPEKMAALRRFVIPTELPSENTSPCSDIRDTHREQPLSVDCQTPA